jgi:hypothetical protein
MVATAAMKTAISIKIRSAVMRNLLRAMVRHERRRDHSAYGIGLIDATLLAGSPRKSSV